MCCDDEDHSMLKSAIAISNYMKTLFNVCVTLIMKFVQASMRNQFKTKLYYGLAISNNTIMITIIIIIAYNIMVL